ncbi:MAG: SAF domain-containing protein, partial [Actinomycetaceae bacterium]|nr:SAF domain-containing protein [Actinomycetaceae bacterium]
MSTSFRRLASRWRDPRLAVGVLLVSLSAVGGGIILSGPQTHAVYQATTTLVPGEQIDVSQLVLVDIDPYLAQSYVGVEDLAAGSIAANTIRKGELVAKSSLRTAKSAGTRVVIPLGSGVPSHIETGDTLSLWRVDKRNTSD